MTSARPSARPRGTRFSAEEDARLRAMAGVPARVIAQALGRSVGAVFARRSYLGETVRRDWTTREEATLRALYGQVPAASIGVRLGRTKEAVEIRANRMGLRARPVRWYWSPQEVAVVKALVPSQGLRVAAEALGRSVIAVREQARDLGLRVPRPGQWTDAEDAVLRAVYASQGARVAAQQLPLRTLAAVKARALSLGLRVMGMPQGP